MTSNIVAAPDGAVKVLRARTGFCQVDHAVTADANLTDAEFRALVALDQFRHRRQVPTNRQLAAACGWADPGKARRVLHALAAKGRIVLETAPAERGFHREKLVSPPLKTESPPAAPSPGAPRGGNRRVSEKDRKAKTGPVPPTPESGSGRAEYHPEVAAAIRAMLRPPGGPRSDPRPAGRPIPHPTPRRPAMAPPGGRRDPAAEIARLRAWSAARAAAGGGG